MVDCPPPPAPLTNEQLHLLFDTIRLVEKAGFGEVKIVIENGHPRFIVHQLSQDLKPKGKQS